MISFFDSVFLSLRVSVRSIRPMFDVAVRPRNVDSGYNTVDCKSPMLTLPFSTYLLVLKSTSRLKTLYVHLTIT